MSNSRFIPGIFNYCDYWCERCSFTRRCRNFAMGKELERQAESESPVNDATNAEFWNQLALELQETAIRGKVEEFDVLQELDYDYMPDPEWEMREDARQRAIEIHPLVSEARTYMERVDAWFKNSDMDLKSLARELMEDAKSRFSNYDCEEEAREIGEMLAVVNWYHTLIPPKLGRAVSGIVEHGDPGCFDNDIITEVNSSDANGSGKVVLISIERSMAAWLRLRKALPQCEDEILAVLAILDRLRHGIHSALPGARAFLRPGFDVEPQDV